MCKKNALMVVQLYPENVTPCERGNLVRRRKGAAADRTDDTFFPSPHVEELKLRMPKRSPSISPLRLPFRCSLSACDAFCLVGFLASCFVNMEAYGSEKSESLRVMVTY
jgi:hypothetical protein